MNIKDIFEFRIKDIEGPLIYRILNTKNNKCYVGQTKKSIYARFCYSGYSHKLRFKNEDSILYSDMRSDIDSFIVEILELVENKEDLDSREIYWISKFDSLNNGYNRTIGGKSVNKEASNLAHKHGYLGAKDKQKGCFYNPDKHREVCSIGGVETAKIRIMNVISELKSRNLTLNEENYNKIKREIGPRMCPLWKKANQNHSELFI